MGPKFTRSGEGRNAPTWTTWDTSGGIMELKSRSVSRCDHGVEGLPQRMQGVSSLQAVPPKAPGSVQPDTQELARPAIRVRDHSGP